MTQSKKIEVKFYPLTQAEWVKICKELSNRAKDLLIYLRTVDPYGNGQVVVAAKVARELGISRSTVTRALQELKGKGYLDNLQIIQASVRLSAKGLLYDTEHGRTATTCAEPQQPVQDCNDLCRTATTCAELQQSEPVPPTHEQSRRSKNIQKNQKINRLSQKGSEREKSAVDRLKEENFEFWDRQSPERQSLIMEVGATHFIPYEKEVVRYPDIWIKCRAKEISRFIDANPGLDKFSGNSTNEELLYGKKPWEVEVRVPYPAFEEEIIQYYVHKGEPIEVATAKAGEDLRNPVKAADLWKGFLRKCDRIADEGMKQKRLGCTPYLPPSFGEKKEITLESVIAKFAALSPGFAIAEAKLEEIEGVAEEVEEVEEVKGTEDRPTLGQMQGTYKMAKSMVERQIAEHPEWGYQIIDGVIEERMSIEEVENHMQTEAGYQFAIGLILDNPWWGYEIIDGRVVSKC